FYGALAYRSFFHPLAELEGFLTCFAVGLLFTLLKPAPAFWQVAIAVAAPIVSAVLGATGRWEVGLAAEVLLLAVALEFAARRVLVCIAVARPLRPAWEFGPGNLRPGLAHLALWILPLGNAWVAIALSVRWAGLHMIFLGCFAALLLAAFTHARGARLLLAGTAALFAL